MFEVSIMELIAYVILDILEIGINARSVILLVILAQVHKLINALLVQMSPSSSKKVSAQKTLHAPQDFSCHNLTKSAQNAQITA